MTPPHSVRIHSYPVLFVEMITPILERWAINAEWIGDIHRLLSALVFRAEDLAAEKRDEQVCAQ